MNNIIPFTRRKDITDMPMREIKEWCRQNGWKAFRNDPEHYQRTGRVIIERVSCNRQRGKQWALKADH